MGWSLYADPWFPQSMTNTKDEKIHLSKEYDKEKQDNKRTINYMNILLEIIQMVAKSADSDDKEDGKNNELVDNSIRIKDNECAIKEEQWKILRKTVKQTTVIRKKKKKIVVQNRFQGFEEDSDDEEDC